MKLLLDDARITYSDYFQVAIAARRVTFSRPPWDTAGASHVQPGARMRFITDATRVTLSGINTAKILREDIYSSIGAVFVDGRFSTAFDAGPFSSSPQNFSAELTFKTAEHRLYEFYMPIGASVEITSLELNDGAQVSPAPQLQQKLYVAYGDSISQGFSAHSIDVSWSFRLAQRNDWRTINLGFGGRKATASDGSIVGGLKPDVVTYLMGYNDFAAQTDLETFRAAVRGTLEHIVQLAPGADVFAITPLWALRGDLKPIPLEHYRQEIRNAVADVAAPHVTLIEGEVLAAPDRIAFPDGTHPGDLGNTQVFISLLHAVQRRASV